MSHRLAVITTHPIQYYAPWFRLLQDVPGLDLRVFYLWNFGVTDQKDPQFGHAVRWDVPLLDGYASEFVPNVSTRPGTDHLTGLWNPSLRNRVRAFDADAVLLLTYNYASVYHFLLRWRRSDAPLLFRGDSHRLVRSTGRSAALRQRFISRVFRQFDACLYVGQANKRYFEEHGVESERLFFAPHAVENSRFIGAGRGARVEAHRWTTELGIPPHHRIVLFAGKLEPTKRPLDLLRAFVRASVPDTSLLFVGSGALEAALKDAARGDPRVFFAPFQNQAAMPRTYAAGDLFVLPSGSETWGLAVNEAMCLERPVIVSSLVGCAEDLVEPWRNGLVFPAGDVSALTAALRDALSDGDRLRAWGRAGLAKVQTYSYQAATRGLLQALDVTRRRRSAVRARPMGEQVAPGTR